MIYADSIITADQFQQKPFLLLPDTERVLLSSDQSPWQAITQPSTGAAENFYVFWLKTYFLVQLPIHSLFRCFPIVNASLGKLPGFLPYSPCPKDLTVMIRKDDTDVGSESVCVNHACGYLNSFIDRIVS